MFEKYDVESELFLASIKVRYPQSNIWNTNAGNMLFMGESGYGYITTVCKQNNNYYDLKDMSLKITETSNPKVTSYTIDFIRPLSKYSPLKGKISKRKALQEAKKYYNSFHQEHISYVQEQQATAKTLKKHI